MAPQLKERIIVLRSATKALSASGERMAVLVCFNQKWRDFFNDEILLSYLHLPKSLQYAYANAMFNFSDFKRAQLTQHYQLQINVATKRLKDMNVYLPDKNYSHAGTFYIIADLHELLGTKIANKELAKLLGTQIITNDHDLCYALLFEDQVALCPLSYFGVESKKGFVRITCSGGIGQINQIMDIIETRLDVRNKQ